MVEIKQAETPAEIETARELFREYEKLLDLDLCFQGFAAELAGLPGGYAEPDGRLLLASVDGKAAGCIALRKLAEGVCEMKRLFVRPAFRGLSLGKMLIARLIAEAAAAGYKKMRLDTYPPKMQKAVRLYQAHGFREIPPYHHNPNQRMLFLELIL